MYRQIPQLRSVKNCLGLQFPENRRLLQFYNLFVLQHNMNVLDDISNTHLRMVKSHLTFK